MRKPRSRADERKPRFRDPMVMIHDQPSSANDHAIRGH